MPIKYKKMDNSDVVGIMLEKMYDRIAEEEIENIMEKTRIMLGFAPEDYEIKRIKDRLAKCDEDKKITINPDITVYSRKTIEYIVLHQYCHLKYKTHAKGFYDLIKRYMPDYEKQQEELSNLKF